jgi:hypothetical protein
MASETDSVVPRPRRWKWRLPALRVALVLMLGLVVAAAIARMTPLMAPVRDGSLAAFWKGAFRWDREPVLGGERAFGLRSGWYIYKWQHMHGSYLYRVPEAEVNAHLPEGLGRLAREVDNGSVPQYVQDGYRAWRDSDAGAKGDLPALLSDIEEAQLALLRAQDPESVRFHLEERKATDERLQRAESFWATQLFEWVFLTGLGVILACPLLWHCGKLQTALHLGAVPVLFFLPLYLGYATYTFTSAGPSGGIVYPWLVVWFRTVDWPRVPWDRFLVRLLPHVLAPLSPSIGSPMALSGGGAPGPTAVIGMGLLLGSLVYLIPFSRKHWRVWAEVFVYGWPPPRARAPRRAPDRTSPEG